MECEDFVQDEIDTPDVEKCLSFGHLVSATNTNATEACCQCQYSYSSMSSGGYRGELIGKILRIGLIDISDVPNVYSFSRENGTSSGLIYDFLFTTFQSAGANMIATPLSNEVEQQDNYDICIHGK